MNHRRVLLALLAVIVGSVTGASAQERIPRRAPESRPAPAKQNAGTLDYVAGLEALEAGDYTRAVASFTRAIEADDDSADYHLARGVANTLAEQFPAAVADLERALKLRPGHRETRLWLQSVHQMANDEVFRNPKKAGPCFVCGGDEGPRRPAPSVAGRHAAPRVLVIVPGAERRRSARAGRIHADAHDRAVLDGRVSRARGGGGGAGRRAAGDGGPAGRLHAPRAVARCGQAEGHCGLAVAAARRRR